MKQATKRKNASRLGRQPVQGKNGNLKYPTMNDHQTAQTAFYRTQSPRLFRGYMEALLAAIPAQFGTISFAMFRASNVGFIKPCDQDVEERNPVRPVHYEIDDRGVTYLVNEGLLASEPGRARIKLYKHALLATHGTASIEAGIKDNPQATLLPWDVLKENVPQETLELDYPFGVPCTYDGEPSHAHADSPPFGIRLELPDHTKTRYFPGIEADTGSKNRTQMEEQLSKYLDIETKPYLRGTFRLPRNSLSPHPFHCEEPLPNKSD